MTKKLKLSMPNVMCAACVTSIENTLDGLTQLKIREIEIWDKEKKVKVRKKCYRVNIPRKLLLLEVEDNGMEESKLYDIIINALDETGNPAEKFTTQLQPSLWPHVLKAVLGIGMGLALLGLSAFGVGIPMFIMYILTGVSVALSLYLGKESFLTSYKKIRKSGTLEMNSLFAVSSLVAIGVSIAALFVPWLPMMLDAALMIFGFRHLGIAIEEKAKRNITSGLNFKQRTPKKVLLKISDDLFEERDIETIKPGNIIRIISNQLVPLDGICKTKKARIDTSIMDGATNPRVFTSGGELVAGMRLESKNPLDMEVTHNIENSFLAQLDKKMEQAEMQKAPLETAAEKILKYFVPGVFLLAGIAAIAAAFFLNPALAVQCATSLLVSACPCTLGTIVPLAITVGMNKAAKQGVEFKSGKALQIAAETDTVIFDLHGTLTEGVYQVKELSLVREFENEHDDLRACLYELEKDSEHAVGKAIKLYLQNKIPTRNSSSRKIEDIPGEHHAGKKLKINDVSYLAGNSTMMLESGVDLSAYQELITTHMQEQVVFFARDNKVVGHILLEDPLKAEALSVVQELQRSSQQVHICTGADRQNALYYAQQLNISPDRVLADCVPIQGTTITQTNSKSAYIQKLQDKNKKVAMIGDAENDIVPFKACNLAILVKSKSTSATLRENVDVIIQKSSLLSVLSTFSVARKTVGNIKQNLGISLGYNLAVLVASSILIFAIGFAINPGLGVAMMIVQAGLVLLNVYRLKKQKDALFKVQHTDETPKEVYNNTDLHEKMGLLTNGITHTPKTTTAISANISSIVPFPYQSCATLSPQQTDGFRCVGP